MISIKKEIETSVKPKVKAEYLKDSPHLEALKPEYTGELEEVVAELLRSIV